MDPQKLLLVDKRVVQSIRSLGLVVSLILALISVLIYKDYIAVNAIVYKSFCVPIAFAFMALGFALAFWNPYTIKKVKAYTIGYIVVGAFMSTFIIGFSSFTFLGWLMLITTVGVYLRFTGATITYAVMVLSLLAWLLLQPEQRTFGDLMILFADTVTVGATAAIFMVVWNMTNRSVKDLEASETKQKYVHEQLLSLVNSMADGVIAVDESIHIVLYNGAALNILDLNSSMKGKHLKGVLKPFDKNNQPVNIAEFVRNAKIPTTTRDLVLHYSDDSQINLYLAVAPVKLGFGEQGDRGYVLLLRDITHEKSLEEERDEFISVVSHELRTPLAITEGNVSNAQFIVDSSGDMKLVRQALKEAHEQVLFLAGLVNDLSTLSRAERGVLQVEVEEIDPRHEVEELAESYREEADAKNLKVETEFTEPLSVLHSSSLYAHEILQNFVTNAIKYTEQGSVTIGARSVEKGVEFWVKDTGIGISKSDQEKVFDKFFRSEDYRTRKSNGTGLGLYVTMKLARLIHAEIRVESQLNHGSTFTIFIPDLGQKTGAQNQ